MAQKGQGLGIVTVVAPGAAVVQVQSGPETSVSSRGKKKKKKEKGIFFLKGNVTI